MRLAILRHAERGPAPAHPVSNSVAGPRNKPWRAVDINKRGYHNGCPSLFTLFRRKPNLAQSGKRPVIFWGVIRTNPEGVISVRRGTLQFSEHLASLARKTLAFKRGFGMENVRGRADIGAVVIPRARSGADRAAKTLGTRARKRLALAVPLALSACATTHSYTPTYCITKAQLEQLKAQEPGKVHDKLTGDASKDVGIIAGNAIRLRAYSDGLLQVLGGCVDPGK